VGTIQADPRKLKQIVYNLLSNAVKFSRDAGDVTLHAARVPRADVGRLSESWAGRSFPLAESAFTEFLAIRVIDSGIGISRDGLARLFQPFSQIDGGLARQFEGTGLGLAMVKLLAELHGGTVAVESAEGQGSRFTVWLPLRSARDADGTPARSSPATRGGALPGGKVALVVEDDARAADLIGVQLEAEGFTVLRAVSAEAALTVAAQQPLALVTLDIMLPDMDGWELLERVRRMPNLKHLPVVIVSIAADRLRGLSLGASAVLQKPISREQLSDALGALGLRRGDGSTAEVRRTLSSDTEAA
jgi:CheY-like chemotaxis protein